MIFMNNLQKKLDNLKWLKAAGIEYYCSDKKDSKNSLIPALKELSRKQAAVNSSKIVIPIDIPEAQKATATLENNPIISNDKAINEARKAADKANSIDELRQGLESFEYCDLKHFATHTVFADGIQSAPILLLGEAPGATEDEQAIPFCGESGILLDKMLATIGISREKNAYITNSIFWRPPANRRPTTQEIEICKPFVEKHIALINPKLIILVGGTSITSLLGKKLNIADIRQNNYPYINQYLTSPISTTAIFHPAFLLRQPTKKKDTWYDLLKIKEWIKLNIGDI